MKKYVSLNKRSKKAQREYHAKQRRTWGELNPVTRSVPSGKVYNRKKEKQKIGREFKNGFDADLLLCYFLTLRKNIEYCLGNPGMILVCRFRWVFSDFLNGFKHSLR